MDGTYLPFLLGTLGALIGGGIGVLFQDPSLMYLLPFIGLAIGLTISNFYQRHSKEKESKVKTNE